jgi:hypothetical protein
LVGLRTAGFGMGAGSIASGNDGAGVGAGATTVRGGGLAHEPVEVVGAIVVVNAVGSTGLLVGPANA